MLMKTVVLLPSETSEVKHRPGKMAQCSDVASELNVSRLIIVKTPPLKLATTVERLKATAVPLELAIVVERFKATAVSESHVTDCELNVVKTPPLE